MYDRSNMQFDVMSIGKRIREGRVAKGWSQQRLADEVGKSQSAVAWWESGRNPPSRRDAIRIAAKLSIPLTILEGVLEADQTRPDFRTIPLISWVSAGLVSDVGQIHAVEETVLIADLPPGDYFATEVKGDSMDRVSPEGSRIIVNAADRRLVAAKPYIFSVGGETTYKYYFKDPVPRLEPYSTNPSNRTIFVDQREKWNVIGRVVRSYIDL